MKKGLRGVSALMAALALLVAQPALAQSTATPVVTGYLSTSGCPYGQTACFVQYGVGGTPPSAVTANQGTPNAGGATNSWPVQGAGTAGTPAGGVVSVQGVASGTTIPVTAAQGTAANLNATVVGTGTFAVQSTVTPGQRTIITLDVKTVTTGGTAVNAISAGHRTAGGFLKNPESATVNLCINEIGAASGTTSSGDTTCIVPGQAYTVAPASTAVSVISSDSTHPFSGYGLE